jgi:hypothetical protein
MFRSASARQSDLAERRLAAQLDHFDRTAATWFNGTAASVDERLAHLDHILVHARDTAARLGSTSAGRRCVVALPVLEQTRRELAAARGSLLTGFSDRQTGERKISAGRRTSSYRYADGVGDPTGGLLGEPLVGQGAAVKTPTMVGDPTGGLLGETAQPGVHPLPQPSVPNVPGVTKASTPAGSSNSAHIGRLHRAVELGSRNFLATQNTDDRDELLIRARHYADNETSTLPIAQARPLVAAFVNRVEELIARRPRIHQAARMITAYEDFDDSLIF